MQEVNGNLWTYPADVRCITTNGFVKKNGECVMGRGCAKEARDMFPELSRHLGLLIALHGNNVHDLGEWKEQENVHRIFSFPVKHRWNQEADPELIARSAKQLLDAANRHPEFKNILLPRPGCGNGALQWSSVKPLLEPILDNRFIVIDFPR